MSDALLFVLTCLGTYRLVRLVTTDKITERARDAVEKRVKSMDRGLGYFVSCPHCVSVWVGGIVVLVIDNWFVPLTLPVLWWLSVSTICGLIGNSDG